MTTFAASVTIVDLPVGTTVTGAELFEAVQTSNNVGQSVQLSLTQMLTLGGLPAGGGTGTILNKSSASNYSTQFSAINTFVNVGTALATSGTATSIVAFVPNNGITSTQIANNAVGTNQLATSIGIASTVSIGSTLTVAGNAVVSGIETVTGTATFNGGIVGNGTLGITGNSVLTGTLGVIGTTQHTGIFNVVGTSTITGTFVQIGTSLMSGLSQVFGTSIFTGGYNFSVLGTALFTSGNFGVSGTTNFTGTFGVAGTATFTSGAFNIVGATNITGTATVTGALAVAGTALFVGNLFGVTATSNFTGVVNVFGTTTITGAFNVNGTAVFTSAAFGVIGTTLFTSAAFGVVGTTQHTGVFNVVGTSAFTGQVNISGTTLVTGTLVLGNLGSGFLQASSTGVVSTTAAVGNFVLLNTLLPNSVASAVDTTSLTGTYRNYLITFENVVPATTSALQIQFATTGTSFISTSYISVANVIFGNGVNTPITNPNSLQLMASVGTTALGTTTTYGLAGDIMLFNPAGSIAFKQVVGKLTFQAANSPIGTGTLGFSNFNGLFNGTTSPVTGLAFSMFSGNIQTGTIKIYGMT